MPDMVDLPDDSSEETDDMRAPAAGPAHPPAHGATWGGAGGPSTQRPRDPPEPMGGPEPISVADWGNRPFHVNQPYIVGRTEHGVCWDICLLCYRWADEGHLANKITAAVYRFTRSRPTSLPSKWVIVYTLLTLLRAHQSTG